VAKRETSLQAKVPPHNREAEQSVLGAMLFDDRAIGQCVEKVRENHFYDEAHRRIFHVMLDLYSKNTPIDLVTVSDNLRKNGDLESVGGATYLAQLLDLVPTVAHVDYYSRIVLEKAWLRELLIVASEIMTDAYSDGPEVEEVLDRAEKRIFDIVEKRIISSVVPLQRLCIPCSSGSTTSTRIRGPSRECRRVLLIWTKNSGAFSPRISSSWRGVLRWGKRVWP